MRSVCTSTHGIDHAPDFDESAVAGAPEDAPMMRSDGGVDQIAVEAANAQGFAGEPAVVDDVGDQDRANFRVSLTAAHRRRAD